LHLTYVDTEIEAADAFFPAFDLDAWRVVSPKRHEADAKQAFAFEFFDYQRP